MTGDTYIDNSNNKTITIISESNGIVLLSDGNKVDSNYFYNSGNYIIRESANSNVTNNQNIDRVDPNTFFNSSTPMNSLVGNFQNLDTSNMSDSPMGGSSVEIIDPGSEMVGDSNYSTQDMEEERRRIQRDIDNYKPPKPTHHIEEGDYIDPWDEVPVEDVNNRPTQVISESNIKQDAPQREENPLIMLVKQAKKVNKFKVNIPLDAMLPKYDLIKMFEESYDFDIIGMIADEIIDDILTDRESLRDLVKSSIKQKVYPKKSTTKKTTKNTK